MAQITRVTSEALQNSIRKLLPSQQGFGEDLEASNVITPIIDLTATAEGSALPISLQQALNFGGATAFEVNNGTSTVANVGGFWRLVGCATMRQASGNDAKSQITLNDGASDKIVWQQTLDATSNTLFLSESVDFIIFLRSTDSVKIVNTNSSTFFIRS